jgi:hypothetical protein
MDNSPRLPTVAILLALGLGLLTAASYFSRQAAPVPFLTEAEIGMVAVGFTAVIFGIQGLISVLLEGRRLHVGIVRPRLTDPLSAAIVVGSVLLLLISVALAYGIVTDWGPILLGTLAGAGALILSGLLVFYKEAFVGDEACFDEREDGVPW